MSPNERTGRKRDYVGVLPSVFATVIGLLVGFVILLICNPSWVLPGSVIILTGASTYGLKGMGQVFHYATPIILTGLSVGLVFKTDLFNIGTPGRFVVGVFTVIRMGIMWTGLGGIQWAVALLATILGGTLWGMVPRVLKACFSVNEVIASIMMNYIGIYMMSWIVKSYKPLLNNLRNESRNAAAAVQILKMGIDKLLPELNVDDGTLLAVAAVLSIWAILNKTTFDYEFRTMGFNRDAGRYAGINGKRSIIVGMVVAGAIAGMARGLLYLTGAGRHVEIKNMLATEGFTGAFVALLRLSHPIEVLFSELLIAYLAVGESYLQLFELSTEVIDIIVAVIIYSSTFALIVKTILIQMNRERERRGGRI